MRLFQIREALRSSLWFMPLLMVVGAIGLWIVLSWVDHTYETADFPLAFTGSPAGAQGLLSAVVSSIITFTAVVFSLTIVALQLASQQFSPRVLRTFLRDRSTQVTLGLFIATLTYSLLVLREVRLPSDEQDAYVPNVAVLGALLILALALGAFVRYLHHIAQSIRVVNIIESVAHETREAIERVFPTEADPPPRLDRTSLRPPDATFASGRPGVALAIAYEELAELAARHDVILEVIPAVGEFVATGQPVVAVRGTGEVPRDDALETVALGRERTMKQDPGFGFRQLVDIACRALSPGTNDPTTAVQCLDQLHDLLRRLIERPSRSGEVCDDDGRVRVLVPLVPWTHFLALALDEIEHYGEDHPQIERRVSALLDDLLDCAPPERRDAIRVRLAMRSP